MAAPKHDNRKKVRRIGYLETITNRYYIFCEGKQTEPLYFKGFKEIIEKDPIYKNLVQIEVQGVGVETLRVIYKAEEFVTENNIQNAHIWCVYDQDSFPTQDFNAVSIRAKNLNRQQDSVIYHVAWSNQCIEYWFILHFDLYESDNDRKYYRQYLHKKFSELGWIRYEKNNEELFNILTYKGKPNLAIRRAKKRLESCSDLTDAKSAPATKVHLLVEELAQFLPDEIKKHYI